jgi:hypothetical protein
MQFLGNIVIGPGPARVTVTAFAPTVTITPADPKPNE